MAMKPLHLTKLQVHDYSRCCSFILTFAQIHSLSRQGGQYRYSLQLHTPFIHESYFFIIKIYQGSYMQVLEILRLQAVPHSQSMKSWKVSGILFWHFPGILEKVLEQFWKIVAEKQYQPCNNISYYWCLPGAGIVGTLKIPVTSQKRKKYLLLCTFFDC